MNTKVSQAKPFDGHEALENACEWQECPACDEGGKFQWTINRVDQTPRGPVLSCWGVCQACGRGVVQLGVLL